MLQNGRHLTLLLSLHSPFKASVAFTFLEFTLKFSGKGFFLIVQNGVQLAFLNRQFLTILVNGKQRPFVLLRRDHHLYCIGLNTHFFEQFLHFAVRATHHDDDNAQKENK